jgi:hypothetical protein
VGTHGEGGQIVQIRVVGRIQRHFFRFRISRIDGAGKDFLADIVKFHRPSRKVFFILAFGDGIVKPEPLKTEKSCDYFVGILQNHML